MEIVRMGLNISPPLPGTVSELKRNPRPSPFTHGVVFLEEPPVHFIETFIRPQVTGSYECQVWILVLITLKEVSLPQEIISSTVGDS